VISVQPPSGPPTAAPTNLGGGGLRSDAILWSWTSVNGETGFCRSRRRARSEAHCGAGQSGGGGNRPARKHFLLRHVHATAPGGEGPASPTTSLYTLIADPTAADFTTFTLVSPTQINIAVRQPANFNVAFTGCQIDRSTDRATWTPIKGINNTYATNDTTVVSGTQVLLPGEL